jgi:hypothetical protein
MITCKMNVMEADYEFWNVVLGEMQMCPMTGFDVEHVGSATREYICWRSKIQVVCDVMLCFKGS